jgi:oxygen-independent coproporphyrinogen-3 oxidase
MAGLYLHIPYCKQACHYCDFHFSTNTSNQSELVKAICKELSIQKDFLQNDILETVYFGGGTPSLLSNYELEILFESIYKNFKVNKNAEITLEANPDDISIQKLNFFKQIGINRLSIGLQTFNENSLKWMNRAHSSLESLNSVKLAQDAGFSNISIDLIYGIPAENHVNWENDLKHALALEVPHISAYCLTIEEKTAFGKWKKKGQLKESNEDFAAQQFEILLKELHSHHFIQYEISNFGKENSFSIHNSNYWKGVKYLGVGPGAHSYDGQFRQYNISNNTLYINSLKTDLIPFKKDILSEKDIANDYLLTSLRTIWGTNIDKFNKLPQTDYMLFLKKVEKQVQNGFLFQNENTIILTDKGKLLADAISSDLFFDA